ncbi:CaiB/BaiF CoA-transferase family protein [Neobacillus niacini]|uniref:CaiB/BaiF CoA transferase family protein n=1 Tax=Neobacillus niacini TaxID=86668 RepID=UPI002FFF8CBD
MISFEGIKILDLTRLLPGAYATQYFAELGAEVIKIEDTGAGDYLRELGPSLKNASEFSSYFFTNNYNKKSVSLDLKTLEGKEIFFRLVEKADIIIEGFRPGTVERLGIDYISIRERKPEIIYCSISAYGQQGARSKMPGHDINFLSLSGFLDVNGNKESTKPAIPGTQFADLGSGMSAILGIVSSLYNRQITGNGQYLDVSMYDVISSWMLNPYIDYLATGRVSKSGSELLSGGVLCYHVYQTSDNRYLAFGAVEDKFWEQICKTLEMPELRNEAFSLANDQNNNYLELKNKIKTKTLATWVSIFDGVDCCVTPVLNTEEAINDQHFKDRNLVEYISLNDKEPFTFPKMRLPIKYGIPNSNPEKNQKTFSSPPKQGSHTELILKNLNFTDEEIAEFVLKGIIVT